MFPYLCFFFFCSVCNSMNTNCAPCYQNISTAGWNESFHINRYGIEASLTVPYELGAASVLVWVDIEEVNQPWMVKSVLPLCNAFWYRIKSLPFHWSN